MPVIVANPSEAATAPPRVPSRPDQQPYRYEMLCNSGTSRVYADTADELLAALIRGYDRMGDAQRLAARLAYAARVQATAQADINYAHDLDTCSPEEQVILFGTRAIPPEVATWSCPIPLILIDVYYEPDGTLPRPSGQNDVANPVNIIWLSPYDPTEFVYSLTELGVITVAEHSDYIP